MFPGVFGARVAVVVVCGVVLLAVALTDVSSLSNRERVIQHHVSRDLTPSDDGQQERTESVAVAALYDEALRLTTEEAESLERSLAVDKHNVPLRQKLLMYYWYDRSVRGVLARRRSILWLIENYPTSALAGSREAQLYATGRRLVDPVGFRQGRALWLAHARAAGATALIIQRAVTFIEVDDVRLAVSLLENASDRSLDESWCVRLGALYGRILSGGRFGPPTDEFEGFRLSRYGSALGDEVRRRLESSRDPQLLLAAANVLMSSSRHAEFDALQLATRYLERVREMNPESIGVRAQLAHLAHHEFGPVAAEILRNSTIENERYVIDGLSEEVRFGVFPALIQAIAQGSQSIGTDAPEYVLSRRTALKNYAIQLLALAASRRGSGLYGKSVFVAHMGLSTVAILDNDCERAAVHLRYAADAPSADYLAYDVKAANWPWLFTRLLGRGHNDDVAGFFERFALTSVVGKEYFMDIARAIRSGRMPRWYERGEGIAAPLPMR